MRRSKYLLAIAVLTLLGLSVLVFVFLRAIPGDAAILVLGADASASPEHVKALRQQMGLEDPLPVQYAHWLGGVIRADLGNSLFTGHAVTSEIRNRISTSFQLALLSLIFVLAGVVAVSAFGAATVLGRF